MQRKGGQQSSAASREEHVVAYNLGLRGSEYTSTRWPHRRNLMKFGVSKTAGVPIQVESPWPDCCKFRPEPAEQRSSIAWKPSSVPSNVRYTNVYVYVCIHIYAYIYMYTYIYICIYIFLYMFIAQQVKRHIATNANPS